MAEIKFLYQPVKPWRLSQRFGERGACVATDGTNKVISCDGNNPPKGYKCLYDARGHLGNDVPVYRGQEIYAAADGVVDAIDTNPRTGLDVRIVTKVGGRTFKHVYEHLLGYQPKVNEKVQKGQLIGWGDSTGYSSRDHLHFQLEELVNGQWVPKDPQEFMFNIYVGDQVFRESLIRWIKEFIAKNSDNLAYWLRSNSNLT